MTQDNQKHSGYVASTVLFNWVGVPGYHMLNQASVGDLKAGDFFCFANHMDYSADKIQGRYMTDPNHHVAAELTHRGKLHEHDSAPAVLGPERLPIIIWRPVTLLAIEATSGICQAIDEEWERVIHHTPRTVRVSEYPWKQPARHQTMTPMTTGILFGLFAMVVIFLLMQF